MLWLQEPDLEVLANMLEAIQDTVRLVGPALLTQEQLGQAFERFRAVLDDSAKRRKERSAITTGEDFDDEEAEALEVRRLQTAAAAYSRLYWSEQALWSMGDLIICPYQGMPRVYMGYFTAFTL